MTSRFLNVRVLAAAGVITAAAAFSVQSAHAASAVSGSTATSVQPIAIKNDVPLNFGKFSNNNSASAGTIKVSTTDEPSQTGDMVLVSGSGVTAAQFTVTGESDLAYTISLPGSLNVSDGTNTMEVTNFVSSVGELGALSGGAQTFKVGATLNVPAGSLGSAAYTGDFTVTVEYN